MTSNMSAACEAANSGARLGSSLKGRSLTRDDLPAWAALSAGNMAELILPERIREVLILPDRDEPREGGRRPGLEAAHALARRLRAEGRTAEVRWAISGKDANDVLRARRAA